MDIRFPFLSIMCARDNLNIKPATIATEYSLRRPYAPENAFLLRVVDALSFDLESNKHVGADDDDEGGGDDGDDDLVGEDEARFEGTDDADAPI